MAVLNVLKYPDENLKKIAEPINKINEKTITIINDMVETTLLLKGIGLAATQVNIHKRIIIIIINQLTTPLIMINPLILNKSGQSLATEGCLSFPNTFVKVKRNKTIKVQYLNVHNEYNVITANNLLSICIQHEIDHLNGITLYNKMSSLKKKLLNT